MQLTRIPPYCMAAPHLDWLEGHIALLVDPDPQRLEARRMLLAGSGSSVERACTPCEVFGLDLEEHPQVTILSAALGAFQLQAVAEYVRHRWPHTKILVVGETEPHLEDHLYDDAVAEGFDPSEFVFAVKRCGHGLSFSNSSDSLAAASMLQFTRPSGSGNFVRN